MRLGLKWRRVDESGFDCESPEGGGGAPQEMRALIQRLESPKGMMEEVLAALSAVGIALAPAEWPAAFESIKQVGYAPCRPRARTRRRPRCVRCAWLRARRCALGGRYGPLLGTSARRSRAGARGLASRT